MEQHLEAWQHAFSRYGVNVKESEFYMLEGRGVKMVVDTLIRQYHVNPDLKDKITQDKVNYYNNIFKAEFYDGLYTLLDMLQKNKMIMAVVTGGMRDRVNKIISDYFKVYFSAIVTSADVVNTKPFPEPYINAATQLGIAAEDCIVIENAPLGIKAAKDAGMFVFAIQTTLSKEYLKEADVITKSFAEIEQILKKEFLLPGSGSYLL